MFLYHCGEARRPRPDPSWGRDGNIAGTAQQSLEQKDTDLLLVDDKDFRVKNIR